MDRIVEELRENSEAEYARFQQKLLPGIQTKILGVRTPYLRQMAKRIHRQPKLREAFLKELPHTCFEENQLHSFLIAENRDFASCIRETEEFLPYLDNWATTDQATPKVFFQNREKLLPYIKRWLKSTHPYTIRYAIEALMKYYLEDAFDPQYLEWAVQIRSEEYYVNMMLAWYFATALAKRWEAVIPILQENRLDVWVHNKTIQKAKESYRITPQQKQYLTTLRRKER